MSSTPIATTNPFTFPCFSNLPPELRNQIWNESLLEKDRPALFPYRNGCWSPIFLTESDKGYIANTDNIMLEFCDALLEPIRVDVPVYFVSREARAAVLSWAQRQGVRIQFCEKTRRHDFARLFDKEQDTLYVALSNFADFFVEPYNRMAEPDLFGRIVGSGPSLRHIAVPEALLQRMPGALEEIFEWFRGIEVIFIVVGAYHSIHQKDRWEIQSRRGKALLYTQEHGRFDWDDGENICFETIYERVEQATKRLSVIVVGNHVTTLRSIQPVFAVRV